MAIKHIVAALMPLVVLSCTPAPATAAQPKEYCVEFVQDSTALASIALLVSRSAKAASESTRQAAGETLARVGGLVSRTDYGKAVADEAIEIVYRIAGGKTVEAAIKESYAACLRSTKI